MVIKKSVRPRAIKKRATKSAALVDPPRRRKAFRPRTLIGVSLVLASLGGVWFVVSETNQLEPYLVARTDVPAHTVVDSIEFDVIYLASPGAEMDYLTPDSLPSVANLSVMTALPAGSLVAFGMLDQPLPEDTTTFTVRLGIGGAPWLVPGARVEVWVAAPLEDQAFSVPVVVSPRALVMGVRSDDGFAADPTQVSVDVVVHRREIAELIHAAANNYSIQLSPAPAEVHQR